MKETRSGGGSFTDADCCLHWTLISFESKKLRVIDDESLYKFVLLKFFFYIVDLKAYNYTIKQLWVVLQSTLLALSVFALEKIEADAISISFKYFCERHVQQVGRFQ